MTLFLYVLVGLIAFGQLPSTFFQQDEWAIFGNFLYWQKAGLLWIDRLFFFGGVTHLIPFANIFSYFQFKLFGLTFAPYAWTSIFLHIINALLVMRFVLQLKGTKALAILSGLFFLINPTTHQAVTWIATSPGTVASVTCTLLTLIFFLRGKLIFALFWFIAALGFKESSVFLFLYLPVLWILLLKNDKRSSRHTIGVIILFGLIYMGIRLVFRYIGPAVPVIQSFSQPPPLVYLYRLMTHAMKALSQSIVPQGTIVHMANELVKRMYPQFILSDGSTNPYIVESVGADIVSYMLSFMVLGTLFMVGKSSILRNSLLFIIMSMFPLIAIPGKAGYISLFDGRHLYMTSIGVSIVLAIVVVATMKKFSASRWVIMCIAGAYIIYSIWYIQAAIAKQVTIAATRKTILEKVTAWHPKLPKKTLILTQSDKSFYGLPPEEHILPFQSGFGNMLLVWYDVHGENFPACFFERKFLYELLSEDYKECDGRGFGYFRYPMDTRDTLDAHNLTSSNVFIFSYSYKDNSFIDLTK